MKKKLVSLFIGCVMVASLAGCGNKENVETEITKKETVQDSLTEAETPEENTMEGEAPIDESVVAEAVNINEITEYNIKEPLAQLGVTAVRDIMIPVNTYAVLTTDNGQVEYSNTNTNTSTEGAMYAECYDMRIDCYPITNQDADSVYSLQNLSPKDIDDGKGNGVTKSIIVGTNDSSVIVGYYTETEDNLGVLGVIDYYDIIDIENAQHYYIKCRIMKDSNIYGKDIMNGSIADYRAALQKAIVSLAE